MPLDPTQRAQFAANLLSNPVFDEAFNAVRTAYLEKMVSLPLDDVAERDRLYHCVHALADVKTVLTICVNEGKIEEHLAKQKETSKNAD